jgi:hypothetical protein
MARVSCLSPCSARASGRTAEAKMHREQARHLQPAAFDRRAVGRVSSQRPSVLPLVLVPTSRFSSGAMEGPGVRIAGPSSCSPSGISPSQHSQAAHAPTSTRRPEQAQPSRRRRARAPTIVCQCEDTGRPRRGGARSGVLIASCSRTATPAISWMRELLRCDP